MLSSPTVFACVCICICLYQGENLNRLFAVQSVFLFVFVFECIRGKVEPAFKFYRSSAGAIPTVNVYTIIAIARPRVRVKQQSATLTQIVATMAQFLIMTSLQIIMVKVF